jgi:hypothetical protein
MTTMSGLLPLVRSVTLQRGDDSVVTTVYTR